MSARHITASHTLALLLFADLYQNQGSTCFQCHLPALLGILVEEPTVNVVAVSVAASFVDACSNDVKGAVTPVNIDSQQ